MSRTSKITTILIEGCTQSNNIQYLGKYSFIKKICEEIILEIGHLNKIYVLHFSNILLNLAFWSLLWNVIPLYDHVYCVYVNVYVWCLSGSHVCTCIICVPVLYLLNSGLCNAISFTVTVWIFSSCCNVLNDNKAIHSLHRKNRVSFGAFCGSNFLICVQWLNLSKGQLISVEYYLYP